MSEPAPLKISSYAEFMAEAERLDPEGFALHRDAARYRWLRARVSGHRALGSARPASFGFPTSIGLPPIGDIMKGSVAQHLDAAIDAQIVSA
jgi:hypothetical protein